MIRKPLYLFYCILILLFSFFILKNLGNIYLWQDEGKTAYLAKQILIFGYPKACDGKNLVIVENSNDFRKDNYAWRLHPWLQYYLVALSFKITGIENAFTARLPFAIFGILSLLIFIKLSDILFKNNTTTAIAATLFTFSVPLLIPIRQCRWYSLSIFFSMLIIYLYQKILDGDKKYYGILFGITAVLLFHSNYLMFFLLFLVLFIHFAILVSNNKKTAEKIPWKNVIIGLFLCFLFTFPFYLYVKISDRLQFMNFTNMWKVIIYLKNYLKIVFDYFFSIYVLAIGIICWFIIKLKQHSIGNLIGKLSKDSFIGSNMKSISLLFLITIVPIIPLAFARDYYFRYVVWMLPFGLLLMALALKSILKFNLLLGLVFIIYFTFHIPYNTDFWDLTYHLPFKNFIFELFHDYDGPIEGIVKYLNENGNKNQTVAINYDEFPIMFYTGMKVIVGYTGYNGKECIPDWVIMRKVNYKNKQEKMLEEYLSKYKYKKITINYPNIQYENREDPYMHNYRTVGNVPRVEIYKLDNSSKNKYNM